ncbi:TPA: hypothetical protein I8438_001528 [Serratia marcescens]|uniref:Gp11 C-terminal domain-containing protein n=1 Tax=Serratia marcescens TaxID=615 RepID=A0AB33FU03_SERMA|nr:MULTISPECIES: hypothetical protein [Serratia]AWL70679.1 hypothetical protein DKC05_25030 [Serratia marcescens]MDP8603920.1 hypothetical protein [Serratia marcescens]MDP8613113.1 hypothetical protein [Serratia marcescens]MDP8642891.1 hypothetical protein [Serratia marcescens]MDP8655954.1 hypothetical protein [Serratia marcescens]
MTTNAILMKIDALLSHQSMTCSQLATELDVTPAEIITPLRKAVKSERFAERNGYYSVVLPAPSVQAAVRIPHAVVTTAPVDSFTGQIIAALTQRDMTSKELAEFTGIGASRISALLRYRVAQGSVSKATKDGQPYYHLEQRHECVSRKAFPWVEGAVVPVWVRSLAAGVQGCESVYIVAELDADKQSQGWPQFITAYIDIRLGRCICGSTAEDVSSHVLRYLPFDHSEVHAPHAE